MTLNTDVFLVSTAGGEVKNLTSSNPASDGEPVFSPDGKQIAYGIEVKADGWPDWTRLAVMDVRGGSRKVLTEPMDISASGWSWSDDGGTIVFHAESRARTNLYAVPAGGGAAKEIHHGGTTSGAEIASDGVGMQRYRESVENFDFHFTAWHQHVWKPVITAVNGICCGGGFHWVADADIVIAASDAQFFDPHVSIGQVVAIEAIGLIRKMPVEAVMRMALVGRYERMDAARAYELGMISEIVDPPDRLRERAQELGETIAKNSPAAMAATKKALWGALESGLSDACRAGGQHLASLWGHPDQEEGPRAFAEKRDAQWQEIGPTAG